MNLAHSTALKTGFELALFFQIPFLVFTMNHKL